MEIMHGYINKYSCIYCNSKNLRFCVLHNMYCGNCLSVQTKPIKNDLGDDVILLCECPKV